MEKNVLGFRLRVFVKPEEDSASIRAALLKLLPFNPEKEKIGIKEDTIATDENRIVHVLSVFVDKQRLVSAAVKNLLSITDKDALWDQRESRLDDDGSFFVRLHKAEWLDGKATLTDSGDCFHITLMMAAYPKNRKNAMLSLAKVFNQGV